MRLKIIKVTNVPLQVTKDQMYTMFGCIGEIEDLKLYPTKRATLFDSRICFIKYKRSSCAENAHYLTNTFLMDRALQVSPFFPDAEEKIPSEKKALEMLMTENYVQDCHRVFKAEKIPSESSTEMLTALLEQNGLPPYPPLPAHFTSSKVEQIRRTLVVANLDSSFSGQQVIDHFSNVGEVKYVRFCKRNDDPGFYSLVEFTSQEAIVSGLKLNNSEIVKGRQIKVYHSVQAIEKTMEEYFNDKKLNELSTLSKAGYDESFEDYISETISQSQPRSLNILHQPSRKSMGVHSPHIKSRSDEKEASRHQRHNSFRERRRVRSGGYSRRSRSREHKNKSRERSRSQEVRSRSRERSRSQEVRSKFWKKSRSQENESNYKERSRSRKWKSEFQRNRSDTERSGSGVRKSRSNSQGGGKKVE